MVKQSLQQSLQQKLSPQQIQLMKLIELSTLEFEQQVKDEIETNPAIDEETNSSEILDDSELSNDVNEKLEETEINDFDLDPYISDDEIPAYKTYTNNTSNDDHQENAPIVGGTSHLDVLKDQLSEFKLLEKEQKIGEYIIGCVDEDGYIRRTVEEIIDDLVFKENLICGSKEIQKVLSIIQDFDPAGIGARNLQECLLIQLKRKKQSKNILFAISILEKQFKAFVNKHYDKICEKFKVNQSVLKAAILEIEKLNPKPASSASQTKYTQQITPDFTLIINDEEITFTLNSRNAPSLNISNDYLNMLKLYKEKGPDMGKENKQAFLFVKQKLDSARWFINAIQQRQQTLIQTMTSIIKIQKQYFLSGDEKDLVPMILKDVSEDVDMDISTISRVVNSKYIETPYGIKSLKYYFSESMLKSDGESVSVKEIKSIIQEKINNESNTNPLNDQALVAYLNEKGYQIARRTVAKYREQMHIPVARLRKRL